jgi:hypothetical protein
LLSSGNLKNTAFSNENTDKPDISQPIYCSGLPVYKYKACEKAPKNPESDINKKKRA